MRRRASAVAALLAAALPGCTACADSSSARAESPADTAGFIRTAREATLRYASQQQAIDDGFVKVGVEFPAMGEHWVNFARVLEDTLAPERPSVLIYANVGGDPKLSGVAYTLLLSRREDPTSFPYAGAWHEHSGSVDEESLPLHHAEHGEHAEMAMSSDLESPRLFILHAWIWSENPAGTFVTDNWSLPLVRLAISEPLSGDAVRALALADDAEGYHGLVLRTALRLTDAEDSVVAGVLAVERLRALEAASEVRRKKAVDPAERDRLDEVWRSLWTELARALPARRTDLERLRAEM